MLITLSVVKAQQPIKSYAREQQPMSWYREQSRLWKKEIDKDKTNAAAWFQYFRALRVLNMHDAGDKRSDDEKDRQMKLLLTAMKESVPESYEYNMARYMWAGLRDGYEAYLLKAAKLGEGHTDHYDHMVNYAEITRDTALRNKYALKLFESGQVSAGMLHYNYNVLVGLAPNAILLTAGDNDTYPAYVLQAMGIRSDVRVVNVYLSKVNSYRKRLSKELGISYVNPPAEEMPAAQVKRESDKFEKQILRAFINNAQERPLYVALSASGLDNFIKPVEDDLYLTGMAYRYSKTQLDDIGMLKRNFEREYLLDYLKHPLFQDISPDLVRYININYTVPMLKLYHHYRTAGDSERAEWIAGYARAVAKGSDYESEVLEDLKK
jgi:hypothetical protein